MSRSRSTQRQKYSPTLLDRLVDHRPDEQVEAVELTGLELSDYLAGIQRDLQHLLNTRQHFNEEQLADFEEARRSIMTYGFPELNMVTRVTTNTHQQLSLALEQAIRHFEPRLVQVRVIPLLNEGRTGEVHFRLEALVRAEPHPERVVFDTTLDLDRQECRIMGET